MEYQASSVTFSKKLSNGHSFGGNSIYDGVFGGPPSKFGAPDFSSRVEDYREIFGGSEASRGSSIPFLEVPDLNERKISVDVRSSKLDYSKIFGGFGDSNFAVPFEQLSTEPKKRKKSEGPRTPAERLSPPEAAENSSCTEGNNLLSQEASHQAFNGVKKFSMSYHKINNGNPNGISGTNGTTHIAQLHAVQGYARLIDEAIPLRRNEDDKPVFSAVNDNAFPEENAPDGIKEDKHFVKAAPDVLAGETGKQNSGGGDEFRNNSGWFKSHSMGKLYDNHGVGRESLGSKLPPSSSLPRNFNSGISDDNSGTSMASKFGIFGIDTTEGSTGVHSPPYFDEELDSNSVAATSAAALRKAIEEAQARIQMAKELMERKKAGLKNGVKLGFSNGLKPEEKEEGEIAYKVHRSKKKTHELPERLDVLHVSDQTRQQNVPGPCQITADFDIQRKVPSSKVDAETPGKEIPSQANHMREEAEEAEQFYEVENTAENWSSTIEVDIPLHVSAVTRKQNATGPGQLTEEFEVHEFVSGDKEADRETLWKEFRSSQVDHSRETTELVEAAEQFYEIDNTDKNWGTTLETEEVKRTQSLEQDDWKEKKMIQEAFKKPQECGEGLKPAKEEDNQEEIEKRIKSLIGISEASDCGKGDGKSLPDVEAFDLENEQKQRVALKQREGEEIVQASYDNDNCEKEPIEHEEPAKDDSELEIRGPEDTKYMKRQTTIWECVESVNKGEQACKQGEHAKGQTNAHGVEDKETVELTFNELHLGEKIAKRLRNDDELQENKKLGEAGGHEKILIGNTSQKEQNESTQEETCPCVATGRAEKKIDISAGDEEENAALEEPRNEGNNFGAADDLSKQDESNNLSENQKPTLHARNDEVLEESEEVSACQESVSIIEVSEAFLQPSESESELESDKEKYDTEDGDVLETDDFPQGLELTNIMKPTEDKMENVFLDKNDTTNVGQADTNFVQQPNDQHVRQFEIVHNLGNQIEELASKMENVEDIKDSEVADGQEDENNTDSLDERRDVDNEINMKAAQFSDTSESLGENVELNEETNTSPATEKDQENHVETPINQSTEENEKNRQETPQGHSVETNEENNKEATVSVEERETDDSLQKEVELEKEHLRKIDEAKEREREREKERIAVERAVREARVRAFVEARERAAADRAAAGARQKMPEARERVGKTSGEADKSVSDKAAKEAKLKAERAAVERATAEARERALEKALSGKATSEARKQNPQYKVPSSTERFDGANGESAQRCKARSERHQRITERAEKALAEKNRRDLLAQKEQTERNRLAETLGIEVKRWSSGKEGNLRALLSTLQYILGPDSGWQPIPLTDIITTAAVKRAYRKATLFVHPDKLQQRGANVQQKYTCEKVFDLLKDAYNKLNLEER